MPAGSPDKRRRGREEDLSVEGDTPAPKPPRQETIPLFPRHRRQAAQQRLPPRLCHRAGAIVNPAVVGEISEDDVETISDILGYINGLYTVYTNLFVVDSEPQFAAMLEDSLPRDDSGAVSTGCFGVFADRQRTILSPTDSSHQVGELLDIGPEFFGLDNGEKTSRIIKPEPGVTKAEMLVVLRPEGLLKHPGRQMQTERPSQAQQSVAASLVHSDEKLQQALPV